MHGSARITETAPFTTTEGPPPQQLADAIRVLTMDAVEAARSGHPGMPMGMAECAVALFGSALTFDPQAPLWPDRDRFVLSAGHGSMLLYSVLHLTGYPGFDREALRRFRSYGALAAGHPEVEQAHGIETTTGPLGQGLATAVGMALAERILNARFGDDLVDHYTYVMCSDGDLMEGISQEAISLAGHLGLARLVVLYDDNGITIDGTTDLTFSEDTTARFSACGWSVETVDGHDAAAVAAALARARGSARPTLIRCRTVIGKGAPTKAGDPASHSGALGAEEVAAARRALGWSYAPFEIPPDVKKAWETFGERGRAAHAAWRRRRDAAPAERRDAFDRALAGALPTELSTLVADYKRWVLARDKTEPTRFASGHMVERLVPKIAEMIGGSGDLTPANNTRASGQGAIEPGAFGGRYIHYGAREHAMAAVMNGMALHGGVIPYAGTFLVFTDYARPAIRLAALMRQRVIHVMTHDSIGLGEDGPTHQPVEHLASLRAMPGLRLFRPADAVEVGECWELALRHTEGPSVIVLSRQDVPLVRRTHADENRSARGAYILAEAEGRRHATIFATGAEVGLALEAQRRLRKRGIGARVVSMPCIELFEAQDAAYRAEILDESEVMAAVEAAARQGWDRYIGRDGIFIGMDRFGASAPAAVLFEAFGITAEALAKAVEARLHVAA